METAKGKTCPVMGGKCRGDECAWWCSWGQDCAVPLLTGMFADSEICRTCFAQEVSHDE